MPKVYIVSFRTLDDPQAVKVHRAIIADNMRAAINMAREHGGADFQSRFDKSTAQAQEMKEGGTTRSLITRREIEQKMDELGGNTTTPTTRKSQKRFLNWLGGLRRWNNDAPVFGLGPGFYLGIKQSVVLRNSLMYHSSGLAQMRAAGPAGIVSPATYHRHPFPFDKPAIARA